MPKHICLSLYIYVTLDNRYGFAISIGNTKIHVATLTCLEWHTMLNIGNATFGYMALILVKQYHGTYACFFLFHVSDDRALCKPGCASLVVIHWYSWRFWWWLVMFVFTDLKWPRVFRCSTPSCNIFCLSKPWEENFHQQCFFISYIEFRTIFFIKLPCLTAVLLVVNSIKHAWVRGIVLDDVEGLFIEVWTKWQTTFSNAFSRMKMFEMVSNLIKICFW